MNAFSDILIAARSARFMQVFSRIGLAPDLGSTFVLPRAIGRRDCAANEMASCRASCVAAKR